ncbi:trypsin inhibitor DE-3-like [Glycine soja]|uniref:Chymotrypsin inhibitor 3 n=2 Tax=Glycine soja TaxID=3848 RepID=A0A445JP46_GLYSO|nr:trypsin inhibitor DE-3-like [Glycine soja]KAG5002220.1 hypothetical protein JHK87_023292 [Glycine soja]RZC00158.1 Chymotrypsin inhibitor 3 [Glycine soja]
MWSTKLFGLFLLSAFTLYPPSTMAQPVFDLDGHPVINGGSYYIMEYMGSGVELAKTGNETCPLSVVQSSSFGSTGLPVKISSMLRTPFVTIGRVDLSFTGVPDCATTPSGWTVVEGLPEGSVVKITGYENTENGHFLIEKASFRNIYKLSFCIVGKLGCGTIGLIKDDKQNDLLGVTWDYAFEFVLVKTDDQPTSSSA